MNNTITGLMAAAVGLVVVASTLAVLGIGLVGLGVMRLGPNAWVGRHEI